MMDDWRVFSLLDQSWYSRSLLDRSTTSLSAPSSKESSAVPTAEGKSETTLRSIAADSTNGTASSPEDGRSGHSIDESELRRVFDRFDEDADGLITGEELRRWCTKCSGRDVTKTEADGMISCVDRNKDGAVDFKDFLSLYQSRHSLFEEQEDSNRRACDNKAETEEEDLLLETVSAFDTEEEDLLLEAFRAFDTNLDGLISPEELQTVLINLDIPEGKSLINCEKMIRSVDRNGDGRCDLRDFQEMMSDECF